MGWTNDFERNKREGRGGLGFRRWSLNKKTCLDGMSAHWTKKTLVSDVEPLRSNSSGVYSVTDLDTFMDRYGLVTGSLDVYGIIRWGGKIQIHSKENVVRANKGTILYLLVNEKLFRSDPEIPAFLSDYYKVPVDIYYDRQDLENKLLSKVMELEGTSPSFSRVEDWLEYQKERKATTSKDSRFAHTDLDLSRGLSELEVARAKEAHSKHRDAYSSLPLPGSTLYLYKVDVSEEGEIGDKIIPILEGDTRQIEAKLSTLTGPMFTLVLRYKLSPNFLSADVTYDIISKLPYEALYFIDSSGKRTKIKNFMQDFETFYDTTPTESNMRLLKDLLDRDIEGNIDTTYRNAAVLSCLQPSYDSNIFSAKEEIKPFVSPRSSSPVDATWEGSDLNKRLLVFGYLLDTTRGLDAYPLVASSPDYLPESALDDYKVNYEEGWVEGPSGERVSFAAIRNALKGWSARNPIGLEE